MTDLTHEQLLSTAKDISLPAEERITAIHALVHSRDEKTIGALIELLKDDNFDVRWAASTALRKYGAEMLGQFLTVLATHPADSRLYESAHRVLNHFGAPQIEAILEPVIAALKEPGAFAAVPVAAKEALEKLQD